MMNVVANVANGVCWINWAVSCTWSKTPEAKRIVQHLHFHLQYDLSENLKRVVMEYDGAVIKKDLQAHTK